MSNPDPSSSPGATGGESNPMHAALFANLVVQQSSMAMIFLGQAPHPESGKTEINLEAAQVFIDTLEMIENKTRGNLGQDEQRMLKQTLMSLRMAYVEAANKPAEPRESVRKEPAPSAAAAEGQAQPATAPSPEAAPKVQSADEDSESHKRFTKKY